MPTNYGPPLIFAMNINCFHILFLNFLNMVRRSLCLQPKYGPLLLITNRLPCGEFHVIFAAEAIPSPKGEERLSPAGAAVYLTAADRISIARMRSPDFNCLAKKSEIPVKLWRGGAAPAPSRSPSALEACRYFIDVRICNTSKKKSGVLSPITPGNSSLD